MAKTSEVICVDSLLRRAISGEVITIAKENYDAVELLALFLKKVMELPLKLGNASAIAGVVLTVERLTKENMDVFWKIAHLLELNQERFTVIDHKKSFYYFALNQESSLWTHDVFLFSCERDLVSYYDLKRDIRTKPQLVSIHEHGRQTLGENRDESFAKILTEALKNRVVSSAYLVGDGFDGDWLKQSLTVLCRGRRAFLGKNLFSKGACYAAFLRNQDAWPYVYMGENEMKFNLSLKVKDKGKVAFLNLISAGQNWFETKNECEVVLNGTPQIDFWKQLPNSREAEIETVELNDFPMRPERTTRLRISASPVSDDKIDVEIRDMGFGEFFRATDKVWKYTIMM